MGRRSRARVREAGPATPAPRPDRGGRLLRALNPIKAPTRSRTFQAAGAFAVAAVVMALLGWATGNDGWFSAVVPLALLGALWGVRALTMPADEPGPARPSRR
jgi:hypothetical protein